MGSHRHLPPRWRYQQTPFVFLILQFRLSSSFLRLLWLPFALLLFSIFISRLLIALHAPRAFFVIQQHALSIFILPLPSLAQISIFQPITTIFRLLVFLILQLLAFFFLPLLVSIFQHALFPFTHFVFIFQLLLLFIFIPPFFISLLRAVCASQLPASVFPPHEGEVFPILVSDFLLLGLSVLLVLIITQVESSILLPSTLILLVVMQADFFRTLFLFVFLLPQFLIFLRATFSATLLLHI
jgi:hypothetical protein